jgi:hypothetical protein
MLEAEAGKISIEDVLIYENQQITAFSKDY